MRPNIFITPSILEGRYSLPQVYARAIYESGGEPLITPYHTIETLPHGLLISGGGDVAPDIYGEPKHELTGGISIERDTFEIDMFKRAREAGIPILCICRGHQVMNVALGGTLIQHVDGHQSEASDAHEVSIDENTLLFDIIKKRRIMVNSRHHQVVGKVAEGLRVSAVSVLSSDQNGGYVEAIEPQDQKGPFLLGIQWHPEGIFDDVHSKAIFKRFIDCCLT